MPIPLLLAITPFEKPDVKLVMQLQKTSALPVLHLGRTPGEADAAVTQLTRKKNADFGLCFAADSALSGPLPVQVKLIILPWGMSVPKGFEGEILYQVHSVPEALEASAAGITRIIAKGNESAGKVGSDASFILVQRILQQAPAMDVWVQGGAGIHTTAGLLAIGAKGVVFDNQLALFPECSAPAPLKNICKHLNGSETRIIAGHRVLVRPGSPALEDNPEWEALRPLLGSLDPEVAYLPMGQDIALAAPFTARYGKTSAFFHAVLMAAQGQLRQARATPILESEGAMAKSLGTTYAIAQGPMTRVSDEPGFAAAVAEQGALPFVALSLLRGEAARDLITRTKEQTAGKPWGVGILGFADPELRKEQLNYIKAAAPPFVLIAGGRPAQAAELEQSGIATFLHVPARSLLDLFLKEGAKRFVFEGRECGGHVGPLSSLVLWELQVNRLLQEEDPSAFHLLFAGGIHDARSAAFISVMTAPLAVRGARIGVLMGTAYLYTREAVETGAIVRQFQDKALHAEETILLETAPGHETRCLHSDFGDYFEQEKQRLTASGTEKKAIWEHLESLNVGRLRIASKGLERREGKLVSVSPQQQAAEGMYMIGQVASLKSQLTDLSSLHKEVAEGSGAFLRATPGLGEAIADQTSDIKTDTALDIAIVGMACVYPDAHNKEEFWSNILQGKDCISEVPDERWNKAVYYDPEARGGTKSPSKWGGFIPKIAFDPLDFGIPPQSLAAIDPSQLISLLVARQALKDAGYPDGESLSGEDISVIIGAEGGNDLSHHYGFRTLYPQLFGALPEALDKALPQLTEDSFPGVLGNVIAGRITNRLNLGGRNYTVDAACASSLAALDLACQELVLGKSDMVIAGAADLHNGINDYLMFASTHALSRKGRCATFDSEADGIALGEGVAMLVLKRREDAVRDGDRIYAVIKGLGGSSDGKSLGLTAPRKSGQLKAMERAYLQAGITPASVQLVEAHGTGTVVGDKTELSALTDMWTATGALPGQTVLGSVKTQIGHTKCAAGMAGIIKSALAVYHGVLPPTLHLRKPNSYYRPAASPFSFRHQASPWLQPARRAGVSAFGFGGTNFHAVIENHAEAADQAVLKSWPFELFVFRGVDMAEAQQTLQKVVGLLKTAANIPLKDLAYSLAMRDEKPVQFAIIAGTRETLLQRMEQAAAHTPDKSIFYLHKQEGKVAFLFPGQGSQRIGMAEALFTAFPAVRRLLQAYPEYAALLNPPAAFDESVADQQASAIRQTAAAQPLLGLTGLAIARLLEQFGVQPDMLAGHSYGELPALCFAGVIDEAQLVPMSEARAAAILQAVGPDKGMMVAVSADTTEIAKIAQAEKGIYAVNHNAPEQWVLAGATPAMQLALEALKAAALPYKILPVECAFHSPLLAAAEKHYAGFLESVRLDKASIPVWSNTLAEAYPESENAIRELLARHLVSPVRFSEEILDMHAKGARLFIEVGPGKVLSGLTRSILGDSATVVHTESGKDDAFRQLLTTLATYLCTGRDLRLETLFEGRSVRRIDLDQPEQYKKSPTLWWVNGQMALPDQGKLPAHGALPVTQPLALPQDTASLPSEQPTEAMVQMYLESMQKLALAQRDVMLGFLGQAATGFTEQKTFGYTQQGASVFQPASTSPASEPNPVSLPEPLQTAGPGQNIKALLLKIVSEKTGYPEDMLDPDLDLEADLSIDSIKRTEIIASLRQGIDTFPAISQEGAFAEGLAGAKTLNALLQWLRDHLEPAGPEAALADPTAENKAVTLTETAIRSLLLRVVSDKTGYPEDMLDPDMDMEADLSIDSIKRTEIIGEIRNHLGKDLAGLLNDSEGKLSEQMAAAKTLGALAQWLYTIAGGPTAAKKGAEEQASAKNEPLKRSPAENTATEKDPSPSISRSRFELTADFPVQSPVSLKGRVIAINPAGDYSEALKAVLEQAGASVCVLESDTLPEDCQGLILLDLSGIEGAPSMMESIALLKQLPASASRWALVLSDSYAYCKQHGVKGQAHRIRGFSGLIKSLALEWEDTLCRLINVETGLPPFDIAEMVHKEMGYQDASAETFYRQGTRHIKVPVPAELYAGDRNLPPLDSDAVVLVTGGAQGITAALTLQLAASCPCRYVLLGRTPLPEEHTADTSWSTLDNIEDIRAALIASGTFTSPAVIEQKTRKVFKENQVRKALQALRDTGARVEYRSVDVQAGAQLSELLDDLLLRYGRIDGVIHGAGILEDKLFEQKDTASFERVYTTKVRPLQILIEKLPLQDLKFMMLFSSVASVFGNPGQTDYAAANSVLDSLARLLHERHAVPAFAINWGPWEGAGMVSPTLAREYARRGIPLLPLEAGKKLFVDELMQGTESQVLIMAETRVSAVVPGE